MMNSNNDEGILIHPNIDSERLTITKKLKKNVSNSLNLIRRVKRNRSGSSVSSTGSSVSSFFSTSTTISETDSFCSCVHDAVDICIELVVLVPKRSCLAGTRRANECTTVADKKKRKVRFKRTSELTHVVKVKALVDPHLWWSSTELKQFRTDIINSAQLLHDQLSNKDVLKSFLYSYKLMREELLKFEENYYTKTEQEIMLKPLDSAPKLSSHPRYNDYVIGYQYGYNALEKYIGYDIGTRRKRISETIQTVCEFYKSQRELMYNQSKVDYEVTVKQYYKSLTMQDRYWAKFSGKVAAT